MLRHLGTLSPRQRALQSGYSFVELAITVGMILIVTTLAMPSFLNYYRSARVKAGAQTITSYLNAARQLAIKTNVAVCVTNTASTLQLLQTNCAGTVLYVSGLNSSSNIKLPDNITLSTGSNTIFGNLGNATTAANYTVTDSVSNRTLHVTVAGSGRITVGP